MLEGVGDGLGPALGTAEDYRRFARHAAAGGSPAYERLADAVATDRLVLSFLEELPVLKRQPDLLFAAARYLLGSPPGPASLHSLVADKPAELATLLRARRTQTNEAARCAVFLPALAALPQPLALLEVGASAGLTLLPDYYSYDYDGHRVSGLDPEAPTLSCRVSGPAPRPRRVPEVAWREGIDLNPLDVNDDHDMAWLSCLVWPGEAGRAERLEAAVKAARRHPPLVHRGDLLDDLARVAAHAPQGATLVVYHSGVLAYVDEAKRQAFAAAVAGLGAVWLSNEEAGVVPDVATGLPPGEFALVRDGRDLIARAGRHGTWMEWLVTVPHRRRT
ncbi:MAG: DUF2332 domain-containing protein [Acidimicrobiales bacterium]